MLHATGMHCHYPQISPLLARHIIPCVKAVAVVDDAGDNEDFPPPSGGFGVDEDSDSEQC